MTASASSDMSAMEADETHKAFLLQATPLLSATRSTSAHSIELVIQWLKEDQPKLAVPLLRQHGLIPKHELIRDKEWGPIVMWLETVLDAGFIDTFPLSSTQPTILPKTVVFGTYQTWSEECVPDLHCGAFFRKVYKVINAREAKKGRRGEQITVVKFHPLPQLRVAFTDSDGEDSWPWTELV